MILLTSSIMVRVIGMVWQEAAVPRIRLGMRNISRFPSGSSVSGKKIPPTHLGQVGGTGASFEVLLEAHLLLQFLVNPDAGEEGIPIRISQLGFPVIPFDPRLAHVILWGIGTPDVPMLLDGVHICLSEVFLVTLEVIRRAKGINDLVKLRVFAEAGVPYFRASMEAGHEMLSQIVMAPLSKAHRFMFHATCESDSLRLRRGPNLHLNANPTLVFRH